MYALARMENAVEHAVQHLSASTSATYPAAVKAGFNALKTKELTTIVCMSGTGMLPTLNRLREKDGLVDRLLMRCLPKLSGKPPIHTGDVVAFKPPPGMEGELLVRRVAAVGGEEMVSDNPDDQAFTLEPGQCWVLADNEELQASQAVDSRSFGPLHVDHILGRILYFVRNQTEHGPVDNSQTANAADLPVLEAELDVEKLVEFRC